MRGGPAARRYGSVVRLSAQLAFVGRGWMAIRSVGALIALTMPYYVWRSVFAGNASVGGLDWQQMKTYMLVSTTFLILVEDGGRLGQRIVQGDVIADVARPLRPTVLQLAECAGRFLVELVVVGALWVLAFLAAPGFAMPSTPAGWSLLTVSLTLAALVKFAIGHAWTLLAFWTDNVYGVDRLRFAVTSVLSGAVVPIAMFPSGLRHLVAVLPFRGIVTTPADVASGRTGLAGSLAQVGAQLGWFVALWVLSAWLWRRGLHRMAVQGG